MARDAGAGLEAQRCFGIDMTIHCNGCAWGQVCPRRDTCAHHVDTKTWEAQRFAYGMPNIDQCRAGWHLLACEIHNGEFEHYEPVNGAAPFLIGRAQMELF